MRLWRADSGAGGASAAGGGRGVRAAVAAAMPAPRKDLRVVMGTHYAARSQESATVSGLHDGDSLDGRARGAILGREHVPRLVARSESPTCLGAPCSFPFSGYS